MLLAESAKCDCSQQQKKKKKKKKKEKKLQTLSEKSISKRLSQVERDRNLANHISNQQKVQHSIRAGKPINKPGEQLIELPRLSRETPFKYKRVLQPSSLKVGMEVHSHQLSVLTYPLAGNQNVFSWKVWSLSIQC